MSAQAWDRVRAWVQEHAPVTAGPLGPADDGLDELEQHLGRPLPSSVVEHFRHAPADPTRRTWLLPHQVPMTARGAVRSSEVWRSVAAGLREDGFAEEPGEAELVAGTFAWSWQEDFLPIAESGSGDCLFVDLRAGEAHGCVMEYDHEQGALSLPWWPSVEAMAQELAEALETAGLCAGYRPSVEAGQLSWTYVGRTGDLTPEQLAEVNRLSVQTDPSWPVAEPDEQDLQYMRRMAEGPPPGA